MPPKKLMKKLEPVIVSDSDSSDNDTVDVSTSVSVISKPSVAKKLQASIPKKAVTMVKFNPADSDRLQLAQAINNITIKAEQLQTDMKTKTEQLQTEMKNKFEQLQTILKAETLQTAMDSLMSFGSVKLSELDIQIEAKKLEYHDMTQQLETDFKNKQIQTAQQLNEFKQKACEEIAKQYNLMLVKKEDYEELETKANTANDSLQELENTFDDKLKSGIDHERNAFKNQQDQRVSILDLTHKAATARLEAQCDQQKKEIEILNKTIDNLKHEIAEQRNLTKEVAQASSKAQIKQKIGSKD